MRRSVPSLHAVLRMHLVHLVVQKHRKKCVWCTSQYVTFWKRLITKKRLYPMLLLIYMSCVRMRMFRVLRGGRGVRKFVRLVIVVGRMRGVVIVLRIIRRRVSRIVFAKNWLKIDRIMVSYRYVICFHVSLCVFFKWRFFRKHFVSLEIKVSNAIHPILFFRQIVFLSYACYALNVPTFSSLYQLIIFIYFSWLCKFLLLSF